MPNRETFTWSPEWDSQLQEEPKVTVTNFGDGYEQRTAHGINHMPQNWTLTFDQSSAAAPEVLAFVRARGAVESFYWRTPLNERRVFVCRKWRLQRKQGVNVISLDFNEVFEAMEPEIGGGT